LGFLDFLKPKSRATSEYVTADIYLELRNRALTSAPAGHDGLWGVLMETGYDRAVATLVTVADGGVSMYLSTRGGWIGMGEQPGPKAAGLALIAFAPSFLQHLERTTDFPLPAKGNARFYVLAADGALTAEAPEAELGYNRHPLSPLFHKAHAVITAMREFDEAQKAKQ
jgi:hypothetical protein